MCARLSETRSGLPQVDAYFTLCVMTLVDADCRYGPSRLAALVTPVGPLQDAGERAPGV